MNISELAKKINVTRSELSLLLGGHHKIGPLYAQKIAAYLGQEDWRRFVHMPSSQLRCELMAKNQVYRPES